MLVCLQGGLPLQLPSPGNSSIPINDGCQFGGVAVVIGTPSVPIYDGCLPACRDLLLPLGTVLFPPMLNAWCLSACRCSAS